jgi:hypothetical protein
LTSERARANAGRTPGGEKRMEMLARMGIQGGLAARDGPDREGCRCRSIGGELERRGEGEGMTPRDVAVGKEGGADVAAFCCR